MQDDISRKRGRREGQKIRDRHRRRQFRERGRVREASAPYEILPPREPLLDPRRQEEAHRHLREQAGFRALQNTKGRQHPLLLRHRTRACYTS